MMDYISSIVATSDNHDDNKEIYEGHILPTEIK